MYIKYKYKLLMILCMILILTTILVSGIWYSYSKNMIVENVFQSMNVLLNEREKNLMDSIDTISYQTRALSYNNIIMDRYLNNQWENEYLNHKAVEKMEDTISNVYASNPNIKSIEIGNYSGEHIVRGQLLGQEFLEEKKLTNFLDKNSTDYLLFSSGDEKYRPDKTILFRNILYYGKNIGYCAVTMEEGSVTDIFEEAFMEDAIITVKGQMDTFLYVSSNYEENQGNKKLTLEMNEIKGEHGTIRDDSGKEWLLIGSQEPMRPFKTCVAIPVKKLLGDMQSSFINIFLVIALMAGVLLLVVYIFSRWIGRNMDRLTEAMQTFSKGRLDEAVTLSGKDEFAKVSEAFNIMTQDIKKLMEDIKETEQEKMTLEIRSLQGQINLHFLFNTLDTIKNLCYIQRATNVENLVDAFMKLLHISMEQKNEYITLETELQYTSNYIEIYKYKSLNSIQCYMNLEDGLKDAMVLKFMIQPIVENAIIHGLERGEDGEDGIIFIKAIRIGEDIEITVMDNGKGFDTSKLATFNGIGLSNTEKRIKIHYGEQYGITAESVEGISTSIKVRLPYRKEVNQHGQDYDSR